MSSCSGIKYKTTSAHFPHVPNLTSSASQNKCSRTCTLCDSTHRLTLMPLRDANASWPGLRAMMSPSTSRLTGRFTNWESRYVQ